MNYDDFLAMLKSNPASRFDTFDFLHLVGPVKVIRVRNSIGWFPLDTTRRSEWLFDMTGNFLAVGHWEGEYE